MNDPVASGIPSEFFEFETKDADPSVQQPKLIGRYRVDKLLAKGCFGLVYLAHDDQLQRLVAIKVPHSHLVANPAQAHEYLTEARTVASLRHPNIVPVFDVGSTDQFPCFVVSEFIDGLDLAQRIRRSRFEVTEAVELMATVAEALDYAHSQGLVHRDIKPENLLLDRKGQPFVADFGLAIRECDLGKGPRFAGTPAYMSPEQARSEGHRVDCRSDIFSLGAVLYELLTNSRPFRFTTLDELLQQITDMEARPLRQIDPSIPKELERICLKALSKRASERYATAKLMAVDLRHFLDDHTSTAAHNRLPNETGSPDRPGPSKFKSSNPSIMTISGGQTISVVPKGLRSFDAHDADFFLELLPGPRDRDGIPDQLRFWKTRIEEMDADETFAVGLIYGPSGCGKSSFVKAGLLPQLTDKVTSIYIEATADQTESRLLSGLRKRCPEISADLTLKESMSLLRLGQGDPAHKIVIIIDQFEQWLHTKGSERNSELVQSLRQCDGARLQCLMLVRDDFWMAATRFMRELEIPILQGHNSAAVDLFDEHHARKVLAAFGRAFGRLSETGEISREQAAFLDRAITGLSQEGKVICVRLALFAEMMKSRTWTSASLKEVGGAEGVGSTFLEETFSSPTAPLEHRYHQVGVRSVLRALLPESGAQIKGHMRSYCDLLAASGYGKRETDFAELIRILDSEVRLITPTETTGKGLEESEEGDKRRDDQSNSTVPSAFLTSSTFRCYQLTHDYLVPSLRDWLTRKQKETRKGRAELLLADRAAVWNARPENRQLPSLWQWLEIHFWTQRKTWTPNQSKLMKKANRSQAVRGLVAAILVAAAAFAGITVRERNAEQIKETKATNLVQRLIDAETSKVPEIVNELSLYRTWANALLREKFLTLEEGSKEKLNCSLALLPVDSDQVEYVFERLLRVEPEAVSVLRDALKPHQAVVLGSRDDRSLRESLWKVAVDAPKKDKDLYRLRTAAVLAEFDPLNPDWDVIQDNVGKDLLSVNALHLRVWAGMFSSVRTKVAKSLKVAYQDQLEPGKQLLAADILNVYFSDDPAELAELVMDANETQFAVMFPAFALHKGNDLTWASLRGEIGKSLEKAAEKDKELLGKRQANAAVALLLLDPREIIWKLLEQRRDPRVRSNLIHLLGLRGVPPTTLIKQFNLRSDLGVRRALLLSLGEVEWSNDQLPLNERDAFIVTLRELYQTALDPGLHSAAAWLLSQWEIPKPGDQQEQVDRQEWVDQLDKPLVENSAQQQQKLDALLKRKASGKESPPRQWYVNRQGQTMIVFPSPIEFQMGSPDTDSARNSVGEELHSRKISRTFALSSHLVTVRQFEAYEKAMDRRLIGGNSQFRQYPLQPISGVTWHDAANYCNWLSKMEEIDEEEWCYEIDVEEQLPKLKKNHFRRTGYRLPTEAEMEYAIRADSCTVRHYGDSVELLGKYAWTKGNSLKKTWQVGLKKPNDFGLFDAHGNTWVWCQELHDPDYYKFDEAKDEIEIEKKDLKEGERKPKAVEMWGVLRGGSWFTEETYVRSAERENYVRGLPKSANGMRVARTLLIDGQP